MNRITEQEFKQFAEYIKLHYGIHLKAEKLSLVASRLYREITGRNFNSLADYLSYVVTDKTGQAAVTLLDRITTNYTYFMREPAHFYFFRDKVLPYLASTVKDKDLRIWSAACSSGEEPYTLAMMIDEYFGPEKARWDTKILATDISNQVLEIAGKGIYTKDKIEALPASWKLNYFRELDAEQSVLVNRIRNEVIFRRLNFMDKVFPFKRKFHVVFCRNVMIYFDNKTKYQLIDKLYDLTEYGGYLFIGHSESLDRNATRFKYVMPAVYRKG